MTLVSRNHDIVDALDDDNADVIGVNLLLTALDGAIGSFANALEIDSSDPTFGVVKGDALHDIVLIETGGDLNVDRIRSAQDDVSLTTRDGGILDAFNDAAADSIGVNLFFQAAGRIGVTDNDFDIDSSTPRPGRLVATASRAACSSPRPMACSMCSARSRPAERCG